MSHVGLQITVHYLFWKFTILHGSFSKEGNLIIGTYLMRRRKCFDDIDAKLPPRFGFVFGELEDVGVAQTNVLGSCAPN